MAASKKAGVVLGVIAVLVLLVVLGVGIATLVKVYSKTDTTKKVNGLSNQPNVLNVLPAVALNSQAGAAKFEAYSSYVKTLKDSLDTSVNPCDDFYAYTCNNLNGMSSFEEAVIGNMLAVGKEARREQKMAVGKKAAYHFNKCVEANKDPKKNIYKDGSPILEIYNDFKKVSGFQFPLFDGSNWLKTGGFPSSIDFSKAIGYLSGKHGIETFLTLEVESNLTRESNSVNRPYTIGLDQTKLAFDDNYYIKAWDIIKDDYRNKTYGLFSNVARLLKIGLDQDLMRRDVDAIFELELHIAKQINTKVNDKRDYRRQSNPYTIKQATTEFPIIDFKTYLLNAMTFASTQAKGVVTGTDDFQFILKEPGQLKSLSTFLKTEVLPRTVYNYFFFRLLRENMNLIPTNQVTIADKWNRDKQKHLGKSVYNPIVHPSELDSDTALDVTCGRENLQYLGYINTRFLIDQILPRQADRDAIKEHVALITAKVLDGFQTQIDQLNWMTDKSKQGAYNKIKYLVRNIAYPEVITSNNWLENYYIELDVDLTSSYLDVLKKVKEFASLKKFEPLIKSSIVRDDYGQSASMTNAWYMPDLNSLTIPAGILHTPFYNINYPASINFGAIGAIAGHEMGHGFDDMGVQFNAFGIQKGWMDDESKVVFDEMAKCVTLQYSQYSPTPNFTIDGIQTLGENLADSAGIRTAYNAFKSHDDLYGAEARLPDDLLDAFTHEQLFFLGFARLWCEKDRSPDALIKQILVDPHSPAKYRVLGAFSNFQAFKSAFNCPEGSNYAPVETRRCNVWASETKIINGIPPAPITDAPNKVNNVDPPKTADSKSYNDVAKRLSAVVNFTAQPCDDFLSYACGNFNQSLPSAIEQAHASVRSAALTFIDTPSIPSDQAYLTLAKQYLIACKSYDRKNGDYIKTMISSAEVLLDQPFPTFSDQQDVKSFDSQRLGAFIGSMYAVYNSDIFMSLKVKPQHQHYILERANALYFDQPRLTFDQQWYLGNQADDLKEVLVDYVTNVLTRYRDVISKTVDPALIKQDAKDIADYEFRLAKDFLQNEYTRIPDYTKIKFKQLAASITSVNFIAAFQRIVKFTKSNSDVANALLTRDVILESVEYFKKINDELSGSAEKDRIRVIYNYMFYRLLDTNQVFLDGDRPKPFDSAQESKDVICAEGINWQLAPVYAHAAIDQLYTTHDSFQSIQKSVVEIADNVQHGFGSMIDSLGWLSLSERKVAHSKVESMVRNIGVPDFVLDDTQLNSYYDGFTYTDVKDFVSIVLDLKAFAKKKELTKLISDDGIDRTEFYFNAYSDPIWSSYDLNSITFTLDVIQPPLYSPDYPAALNFGLLGSLIGHEIGHAFDLNGLNFDQFGQLKNWFDQSKQDFVDMRNCVSNQYKSYCPTISGDTKQCINANNTLNGNLADNTGLQAALRGFRNWVNLKGQDPRLPDAILDRFSNEQLFFLGYAQQFCPKTDFYWYSFGSDESPNEYRLLGTLSNSQNFRSVFNCAVGKKYAPIETNRCNVWMADDKPVLGLPQSETQAPPLNIPDNSISQSPGYHACSKAIEDTIDTRVDPCDDFYGYVCNRHTGLVVLAEMGYQNYALLSKEIAKVKDSDLKPMKQEKFYFEKCIENVEKPEINAKAELIRKFIEQLETYISVQFPLKAGNLDTAITPAQMAKAIGWLSRKAEDKLAPIISREIGPDIMRPELGYIMVIGVPNLINNPASYQGPKGGQTVQDLTDTITKHLIAYFKAVDVTVTDQVIKDEAAKMAEFELLLSQGLQPEPTEIKDVYNPYTIKNATIPPGIDLTAYFNEISADLPTIKTIITDENYRFLISSPTNTQLVAKKLEDIKDKEIPSKTFWNYIFYRIINAKAKYLPSTSKLKAEDIMPKLKLKHFPKHQNIKYDDRELPRNHSIFAKVDITQEQLTCARAVGDMFTEINNRIFVNGLYPDKTERENTVSEISKVAEITILSFKSMLEQTSWLGPKSKKRVEEKLELVARNILYPNYTFDDNFMNDFYKDLDLKEATSNFLDLQLIMWGFVERRKLLRLGITGFDRSLFEDTTQANAFYRANYNSITILAGITQPPFYDKSWPKAFVYGAMGLALGHEIGHGFDPSGISFDGSGRYSNILEDEPETLTKFKETEKCIVDEYSGPDFCMDKAQGFCVNGEITKGENFGDNIGIQTAFRAYKAIVGLYGSDPQLPGQITSQLTNDQLFFVGFARTWCESNDKPPASYDWTNEHPPAVYRVFGALQNFEQFRASFNCPVGSKYAPSERCKVWIDDVVPHLAIPVPPTDLISVNIPVPEIAPKDNAEYKEVADYFSQTIDISQKPCDNFYEYTCNNLDGVSNTNQQINLDVAKVMVDAIGKVDVTKKPYQTIKDYYDQCVASLTASPDTATITASITAFSTTTGVTFPLFDSVATTWLDNTKLAKTIGYLTGTQAISTFIEGKILPTFDQPTFVTQKYIFEIGEPVLTQPPEYYQDPAKSKLAQKMKDSFMAILTQYNTSIAKVPALTDDQVKAAAEGIYKVEEALAANMQSYADRNDPKKLEDLLTMTQLKATFTFLDWTEYFVRITDNGPAAVKSKFTNDYKVSVASRSKIAAVFAAVSNGNTAGITSDMVYNYFNFRILWDLRASLFKTVDDNGLGDLPIIGDPIKFKQYICALQTRQLNFVHSKVYVDAKVTAANIPALREQISQVGNRVIGALKSQIQQTNWISDTVKQNAGTKLETMNLNTLIDQRIMDDATFLDTYYGDYVRPTPLSPATVFDAIRKFLVFKQLSLLDAASPANRAEFIGSSSDTDPIYNPFTNSLSIPAAIAQKPLFNPAYPLASNYGGLGYLIAHALAHSFDQFGIAFDENGNLNDILDVPSLANFTAMSTCLINQYNLICPLSTPAYTPNCIDGTKTLNENVADNAAIHAAYSAYLTAANFQGTDPRLNSPTLGQFTENQLFFLTYVRDFCALPQDNDNIFSNIVAGADNPPKFRVLAAFSNYPAFKSAFNCPATSAYVQPADKICNVWTSDSSKVPRQ